MPGFPDSAKRKTMMLAVVYREEMRDKHNNKRIIFRQFNASKTVLRNSVEFHNSAGSKERHSRCF